MLHTKLLASCAIPIGYLLLSFVAFHFALHTSHQPSRLLLLPLFILFSVLSLIFSKHFFFLPGVTSLWAQSVTLNVVHVASLLLIRRWPAPPRSQEKPSWPAALRATYRMWGNPRLLPEAKTLSSGDDGQPDDEEKEKEKEKGEPLAVFLVLRLIKLPLYYVLHWYILPRLFAETIVELESADVAYPALLARLSDVTAREAVVRSFVAVSWIWESVVVLDGANAVLAVFSVLVGLDQPSDWPPLFGSPSNMCGLRNFWSRFWHRLATPSYTSCGRAVAHYLGILGQGSLGPGAVVAFVAFLLSGLSHAAVSWRLGRSWWLDLQWFLLNFAACLVETLVLTTVRHMAKKSGRARELALIERSWLGWFIGFAWVFGFFFWSVPLWKFPSMHKELMAAERWAYILSTMKIV
ncbi:membrane bound O-acyl transferase family-domain-containing protein [Hypoxylon sp. FL1284]|nr:membrane bound O-acyl transferase family-domain-containing protein [Hypoxylon sp. FL1284]